MSVVLDATALLAFLQAESGSDEEPSAECFTDSGVDVKTCDEIGGILRIPCTLRPERAKGAML